MGTDHSYRWVKIPDKPPITGTTLWVNPSPNSNFTAQDVTLNFGGTTHKVSDYSFIEIIYKQDTGDSAVSSVMFNTEIYPNLVAAKSADKFQIYFSRHKPTYTPSTGRRIAYASDTAINISTCNRIGFGSTDGVANGATDNHCIPLEIKGYK